MIKTRDDLQDCLDKDKRALGVKKSRPSIIGDEVWKFEIALRMDEFYRNLLLLMILYLSFMERDMMRVLV